MPGRKKDEVVAENTAVETAVTEVAVTEAAVAPAAEEAAPAKKTRRPRVKKDAAAAAETGKKAATRRPRKKAVKASFVIQNQAAQSVTYEDIVAKVQAEIKAADVTSIDIYVKAEEGKAYYVVNGEAAGAVDLF